MFVLRVVAGVLIWVAIAVGVARVLAAPAPGSSRHWTAMVFAFATEPRQTVTLTFDPPAQLSVGDPVFLGAGSASSQVGEIVAIGDGGQGPPARSATVSRARMTLYSTLPPVGPGTKVEYFQAGDSIGWVVATLLPPEKRRQVLETLGTAFAREEANILGALQPLLVATLKDAMDGLEEDLEAAVVRHREEWNNLGRRYRQEIVEAELVPLVREVLWPIVRTQVEPTASQIGMEIWQKASIWRFGWRYLYDSLPIMDQNLVQQEWQRFLVEEGGPVLAAHTEELINAFGRVVRDAASDERVHAVLSGSLSKIAADPELQTILGSIFREVVVDNPRLRAVVAKRWSGPEARAALASIGSRLEPALREVGAIVIGTPDGGITPEFARVLRQQILDKDRRWLRLIPGPRSAGLTPAETGRPLVLAVTRPVEGDPWPSPEIEPPP